MKWLSLLIIILVIIPYVSLGIKVNVAKDYETNMGDIGRYIIFLRMPEEIRTKLHIKITRVSSENDLNNYRKSLYQTFRYAYKSVMNKVVSIIINNGGKIIRKIYSLGAISVEARYDIVKKLMEDGLARYVMKSFKVKILLDVAVKAIRVDAFWENNITGGDYGDNIDGIEVAVVDTGIDLQDPYVNRSVIASKSFVAGEDAGDYNGHGTLVASVIVSNHIVYRGVAFKANIINAKAMNAAGEGNVEDIIAAIEWALTNVSDTADIINLSIGTFDLPPDGNSMLTKIIDYLAFIYKVQVVAAAGNVENNKDWINVPADGFNVLGVGSIYDKRTISRHDDIISSFSCVGPTKDGRIKPDVVAPGEDLYIPKGDYLYKVSGTSFSTPMASGSLALIYEFLYHMGYNFSDIPLIARALLLFSADDWGVAGPDNIYGFGYINLARIIDNDPEVFLLNLNGTLIFEVNVTANSTIRLSFADWRIPKTEDIFYDMPHIYVFVIGEKIKNIFGPFKESNAVLNIDFDDAGTYKIMLVGLTSNSLPDHYPIAIAINATNITITNQTSPIEQTMISNKIIYDNSSSILNITIRSNVNQTFQIKNISIITSEHIDAKIIDIPRSLEPGQKYNITVNVTPKGIGEETFVIIIDNGSAFGIVGDVIFIRDDDINPPRIAYFEVKVEYNKVSFSVKAWDESGISRVFINWSLLLTINATVENFESPKVNLSYDETQDVWVGSINIDSDLEGKTVKFMVWVFDNDNDWPGDESWVTEDKIVTVVSTQYQLIILILAIILAIVIILFFRYINQRRQKTTYVIDLDLLGANNG